jgi:prevent-host-death family protein
MRSINALQLRHSLGNILKLLQKSGDPILVQRGKQPVAVLISVKDYQERFVDRDADERRRAAVARIRSLRFTPPKGKTTLDLLRELRAET